jgi:hypothetical protein
MISISRPIKITSISHMYQTGAKLLKLLEMGLSTLVHKNVGIGVLEFWKLVVVILIFCFRFVGVPLWTYVVFKYRNK